MDTSIFRYVLEVEKYRNITQAAKRLFISQPALTKQLNKLEKELGFSPFGFFVLFISFFMQS